MKERDKLSAKGKLEDGAPSDHHFSLIFKEKLPFVTIQSFLSLFSVLF